jgi:hypothetical protein
MIHTNYHPGQTGIRVRSGAYAGKCTQENEKTWYCPNYSEYLYCEPTDRDTHSYRCNESGTVTSFYGLPEILKYLKDK